MAVGQAGTWAGTSTDALIERIAAGDRKAEDELVKRLHRGVLVLVRRHCRPGDPIVEDLAQDVLTRLLERLRAGAMREAAALPAYVQISVVYATSAEYRRRRETASNDALDALPADGSPAEHLGRSELR